MKSASLKPAVTAPPLGVKLRHPHPDQLTRFMCLELSRAEVAPLVRHLLTGCTRCRAVTRRLWALGEMAPLDAESRL